MAALHRDDLEITDIDVVTCATPDHWHAIQCISACDAGKDVYVEKPLSKTVHEGRKMVEAARRYNRVVQVGTHRRSSKLYAQVSELIAQGTVGKVTMSNQMLMPLFLKKITICGSVMI